MCKPTYFDIDYVINSWMDLNNKVDHQKAQAQWDYLCEVLVSLGVKIELIEPVQGLADMTFSGDCGFFHDNKFLASNFRHVERQGESTYYNEWFFKKGYEICKIPKNIVFEGLGDIIYWENDIIFGHGQRSDPQALDEVVRNFPNLKLAGSFQIVDKSFFHLALAACFIAENSIMYYPQAFSEETNKFIQNNFKHTIKISEKDAKVYFACNNIPIGKKIILHDCTPEVENQLQKLGYEVVKCNMGEFLKSGGSCRCLIMKI